MKNITPKASPVVVSHTTPRKSRQAKVAPAGCRTINPVSADTIELNFVARVELLENGCWLWHGSVDTPHGKNIRPVPTFWQATCRADHKLVRAYAYAYEKRVGELPDQKHFVFRNECGLLLCANPSHYRIEARREMNERESLPVARAKAKANPMCRKGLHERTPENTLLLGIHKHPTCKACTRATRRKRHLRDQAKKALATE